MAIPTLLRFVFSKDPEAIINWINGLPYKVELKGNPLIHGNKFYVFYILPEHELVKEIPGGDLDE
jgi:hypothetical protein